MLKYAKAVRTVEANDVKPGLLAAPECSAEPTAQICDIAAIHRAGLYRIAGEGQDWPARYRKRHFAGIKIGAVDAGIRQLNASQCAVAFHGVGHAGKGGNIAVVPQALFDERGDFRRRVNFGLFSEDDTPATLGLCPPHFHHGRRVTVAAPVAVRHLIKPVFCYLRPDPDRFKQDVKARIATHVRPCGNLEAGWRCGQGPHQADRRSADRARFPPAPEPRHGGQQ